MLPDMTDRSPISAKRKALPAWLIPLGALVILSSFASYVHTARKSLPLLVLEDDSVLELGSLSEGSVRQVTLRIANRGTQIALVRRLTASCDCTSLKPTIFMLSPGETIPITLVIDPQYLNAGDDIPAQQLFNARVAARTELPHPQVFEWSLSGTIVSNLRDVPRRLIFNGPPDRAIPIRGFFTFTTHGLLDRVAILRSEDNHRIVHTSCELDGDTCRVSITAPFAEFGESSEIFNVIGIVKGQTTSVACELILRRTPDVRSSVAFVNLGVMTPEEPRSTSTLELVSTSAAAFSVSCVRCIAETVPLRAANNKVIEVAPLELGRYAIKACGTAPGSYKGTLLFSVASPALSVLICLDKPHGCWLW